MTDQPDKLDEYVDGVFAPYAGAKSIGELKADLLADLHERFRDLKAQGKDDAEAYELTIASIGDIEQTVQEVSNLSRSLERQLVTRFDMSTLGGSDFAGVKLPGGKFEMSVLRGSDFSHADLTGSSFKYSDVADANFDGTDLTDANLPMVELARASFRGSILVRTNFGMAGLAGTRSPRPRSRMSSSATPTCGARSSSTAPSPGGTSPTPICAACSWTGQYSSA